MGLEVDKLLHEALDECIKEEINFYALSNFLISQGWFKFEVDKSKISKIIDWLDSANMQYKNLYNIFLISNEKDATMFILRWINAD